MSKGNGYWAGLERPIAWCEGRCGKRRVRAGKDGRRLCAECRERAKAADWYLDAALEHMLADKRCGRPWVCACGPCRVARKESPRAVLTAIAKAEGGES